MKCERCGTETRNFRCSIYTDEMICEDCIAEEKVQEDYEEVRKLERKAIMRGNYNYNYGLPDYIKNKYIKYKGE